MDAYRAAQQELAAQLMQSQQPSSSSATPPQPEASSHNEYIAAQRRLAAQLMQREHSAQPAATTAPYPAPQRRPAPPPLPPRENSSYHSKKASEAYSSPHPPYDDAPPSYDSIAERGRSKTISEQWQSRDPRSSSTQSLRPEAHHGRRTLLLVFIHGFMGTETSFQSFPAHLHNLLTLSLAPSHVVHTKIYPRYKSRRAIEFARDDFSEWLQPHENEGTDVVLVGHSMGGILSAEVALKPRPGTDTSPPFKHHILGTINFDTPFLGMHPGLVGSGIASLFRPAPPPPGSAAQSTSSIASPGTPGTMSSDGASDYISLAPSISGASSIVGNDPYYNPPFQNDIHLTERTGWNKLFHFAKKHSGDFGTATKSYFMSHIEFGGCMADFPGLKRRYAQIRELEDLDDTTEEAIEMEARRIRFVNYYTASTGILKADKIKNVLVKGADGNMHPLTESTSQLSIDEHDREEAGEKTGTPMSNSSAPVRFNTHDIKTVDGAGDQLSEEVRGAPAMKVVKEQIRNLGQDSGVVPGGRDEDEMAPMQMLDAMPIMSDEEDYDEHDHSENEYHDAQDDEATDLPADKPSELARIETFAAAPPDRSAPPIPSTDEPASLTSEESVTPTIIRTPPTEPSLPPLPSVPDEPAPFDPALYDDKDARKIAEKDHKRLVKQYQSALKDQEAAIKDREKIRAKREKKAKEDAEKSRKAEEKEMERQRKFEEKEKARQVVEEERRRKAAESHKSGEDLRLATEKERERKAIESQKSGEELRLEKERERMEAEAARMRGVPAPPPPPAAVEERSPPPTPSAPPLTHTMSNVSQAASTSTTATHSDKPAKPKKDRRFCLLPNDLTRSKEVDKCWVRVYMEGVDEVGAHCGLFFQGPQYESLVGDVGERVARWVEEDATRRRVLEFRGVD